MPEPTARLDAQPDRGEERIRLRVRSRPPRRCRSAARRRSSSSRGSDLEAEVACQRRLDDLLLDLAVERDGDLLADVVLPDVDQRVLLGELGERDAERALVVGSRGTTTVSSVGGAK